MAQQQERAAKSEIVWPEAQARGPLLELRST